MTLGFFQQNIGICFPKNLDMKVFPSISFRKKDKYTIFYFVPTLKFTLSACLRDGGYPYSFNSKKGTYKITNIKIYCFYSFDRFRFAAFSETKKSSLIHLLQASPATAAFPFRETAIVSGLRRSHLDPFAMSNSELLNIQPQELRFPCKHSI